MVRSIMEGRGRYIGAHISATHARWLEGSVARISHLHNTCLKFLQLKISPLHSVSSTSTRNQPFEKAIRTPSARLCRYDELQVLALVYEMSFYFVSSNAVMSFECRPICRLEKIVESLYVQLSPCHF